MLSPLTMHGAALVLVGPFPGQRYPNLLKPQLESMRMATGHRDLMGDLLLPIPVTHSLPRPVAFLLAQKHGHVHNPAA